LRAVEDFVEDDEVVAEPVVLGQSKHRGPTLVGGPAGVRRSC
jgi:hypothetical protein